MRLIIVCLIYSTPLHPDDCYLLQIPGATRGENAVLFSPCYTAKNMNEPVVLRFYHFTYGRDVGSFLVHVTEGCRGASAWSLPDIQIDGYIWEVVGSQSNAWTEVQLTLNVETFNSFQVIETLYKSLMTFNRYPLIKNTPLHTPIEDNTPNTPFLVFNDFLRHVC